MVAYQLVDTELYFMLSRCFLKPKKHILGILEEKFTSVAYAVELYQVSRPMISPVLLPSLNAILGCNIES